MMQNSNKSPGVETIIKQVIASIVMLAILATLAACSNKWETAKDNTQQDDLQGSIEERTDNTLRGKAVEESLLNADFNHDGIKETARVVAFNDGQYFALHIWDSEENLLWKAEAGKAHAGWLSLFLCQLDGVDYLLRYTPSMAQGMCHYQYDLFFLDSSGSENIVASNSVDFDINFGSPVHVSFNIDEIAAFMDEVNTYLENSVVLLNTDGNLEFGEFPLKDTLWWLEKEEGFTFDKTANLSDILAAYKEYREAALKKNHGQGHGLVSIQKHI